MFEHPVIGIFDSGIGGLTVAKEILHLMPSSRIIYFGDRARFPYGNKSYDTIIRYSIENSRFLIEKGATVIIVACNTATSAALPTLQKEFSIPIFGVIEPAAQDAIRATRNKRIAVIGTTSTIRSQKYQQAIHKYDPSVTVFSYACPLLVTLIEEGSPSEKITEAIIEAYIAPILEKKIDTLLLGCTHYPLIQHKIADFCRGKIELIDPAKSTGALFKAQFLPSIDGKSQQNEVLHNLICYSSDDIKEFRRDGERFLGFSLSN